MLLEGHHTFSNTPAWKFIIIQKTLMCEFFAGRWPSKRRFGP